MCANFFFLLFYFGKQILAFQIGLPVPCVRNGKPPVLQPFPQDTKSKAEMSLWSDLSLWSGSLPGAETTLNAAVTSSPVVRASRELSWQCGSSNGLSGEMPHAVSQCGAAHAFLLLSHLGLSWFVPTETHYENCQTASDGS